MNLDYSLLPTMEYGYLLTPSPDEGIKSFINLYDRFCSAIYMASNIGAGSPRNMLSNKAHATSYTRAALAEFAGIDEYIEINFKHLKKVDYSIYKQQNQLFNCAIAEQLNSPKFYGVTFLRPKTNPRPSYDDQGFGV